MRGRSLGALAWVADEGHVYSVIGPAAAELLRLCPPGVCSRDAPWRFSAVGAPKKKSGSGDNLRGAGGDALRRRSAETRRGRAAEHVVSTCDSTAADGELGWMVEAAYDSDAAVAGGTCGAGAAPAAACVAVDGDASVDCAMDAPVRLQDQGLSMGGGVCGAAPTYDPFGEDGFDCFEDEADYQDDAFADAVCVGI